MDRILFATGAILGLFAVAAGAFSAHALGGRISPERIEWFQLGARYQMYHAFAIIIAAWAVTRWPGTMPAIAGWVFLAGIILFSGSLYAMALGAPRWLGAITPIGGTAFLLGWAFLAWTALRLK